MNPLSVIAFVVLAAVGLTAFAVGVAQRYRLLTLGRPLNRSDQPRVRWRGFLRNVPGQRRVLAEPSGIGHFIIFWGFIILGFGELDFFSYGVFARHIPGLTAPWFTFVQEVSAALVMIAVMVAAFRRYVVRPMRTEPTMEAGFILFLIFVIAVTLFLVGGLDAVRAGVRPGAALPVSSLVAVWLAGLAPQTAGVWAQVFFWVHVTAIVAFLAFIPRSKHLHMIGAMLNSYYRPLGPVGKLQSLDLSDETVEQFGARDLTQLTWKQLQDGYACTECGRCHVSCPAALTGKELSPKYLIMKLKDQLVEAGPSLLALRDSGGTAVDEAGEPIAPPPLVGGIYTEDEIWACTTCRACEEACPVYNEHVSLIVDIRRNLVLTEGRASPEVNRAFTNLERHSNEWGRPRAARAEWAHGLDVPLMADGDPKEPVEYLYYVGSAVSFDPRNQKIARAFVQLLQRAGIRYAILGEEEESDGDSARRLGNEFLYQELARRNVELFRAYGVKKIVTTDPHAYNQFRKEYADFGLSAEVVHHSELLAQLLDEGRLAPRHPVKRRATYHDPCYLGRYNEVYAAPRRVLARIPGLELAEMEKNRNKAMCCGAGGGSMFKEETGRRRINELRTEHALATGASVIATACPYCMTMMADGTKTKGVEDGVATYDIAELLLMSL